MIMNNMGAVNTCMISHCGDSESLHQRKTVACFRGGRGLAANGHCFAVTPLQRPFDPVDDVLSCLLGLSGLF